MKIGPSLAEIVSAGVETGLRGVFTAGIGVVVSYDDTLPAVTIQPQIFREVPSEADGSPTFEPIPEIPDVPILFFGGGGFRLTFKPSPGDAGLFVCATQDIAPWFTKGTVDKPGDLGLHKIASAIFIPGLMPFTTPIPEAAEAKAIMKGGEIELRASVKAKIDAPAIEAGGTLALVTGPTFTAWASAVDTALTDAGFAPSLLSGTVIKTTKLKGG